MSQLKKNLSFNIISLVINICVGFLYTPYLVKSLGIIAYGVVPLALIINQYISILATSLTGSLTRFYAVEVQNNRIKGASEYLSSSLIVIIGIIVISLPFIIFLIFNIEKVFNVPSIYLKSAFFLFSFTIGGFYLSLISSFLNIVLYADNRLDELNKVSILRLISKVGFNVLLFEMFFYDLKFIGIGSIISEFIVLIFSLYLFKKYRNKLININIKFFKKSTLFILGSMTMWTIIHQLGDLAIYKIDIFFVNKFWSTKESGILGAISDFGSYIMVFIGVLSSIFGPLILIAFAKSEHENVKKIAINNAIAVGAICGLFVALLIGFSSEFIRLWLGNEFSKYNNWLILKLIALPFYSAAGMFSYVYRSWNKVIIPALFTIFVGFTNVISTYFLCNLSHGDIKYVNYILIFTAAFTLIQTYIFSAYMFKSIYKDVSTKYLIILPFKILLIIILTVLMCNMIKEFIPISNWFNLVLCGSVVGLIGCLIVLFLIFSKTQRKYFLNFLNS